MGGKIECYLDIASYYSYIAFVQLQRSSDLLIQSGVEVELHPCLIGAINVGSGNSPPWKVPAKAKHGQYDMKRAADAIGLKNISVPGDLMEIGKTLVPMRALTYIKSAFPVPIYKTAFAYLFHAFWTLHKIPNSEAILAEVLSEIPSDFYLECFNSSPSPPSPSPSSSKKLFTPKQVTQILDAISTAEVKAALKGRVDEALKRGAFGAPWIWATNANGRSEPFFGSDRWHSVYQFLDLPYQEMRLLPPQKQKARL
ncbi:thioredoxin-like protein [Xylariaceae sp. AK1471]|nr:thioredoxin-like protein [Xylariaceae sp. AK1471]